MGGIIPAPFPSHLPPSGPAGGGLTGTYPNPTVGVLPALSWGGAPFVNGWSNYGNGWQAVQYAKGINGVVYLRGIGLFPGTLGAGDIESPAFNLPVGFRPASHEEFATAQIAGASIIGATVKVLSDGTVQPFGSQGGRMSFSGISFVAT